MNVYKIKLPLIKKIIKFFFNIIGLEIKRKETWFDKYRDSVVEINSSIKKILDNQLVNASLPNRWAIFQSLQHIKNFKIKGDIVETGVFHGGGLILLNDSLKYLKIKKKIWGYDTFEGVPSINPNKDQILGGKAINTNQDQFNKDELIYPRIKTVKKLLKKNGFKKLPFLIKGDTKKTLKIKKNIPKKISLLRLDTDFYDSILNELKILYPKVSKNGIIIIDDYGHHVGCKKAVDKFFKKKKVWLHRVDYTARLIIKK
jgi:O-methyltransferase